MSDRNKIKTLRFSSRNGRPALVSLIVFFYFYLQFRQCFLLKQFSRTWKWHATNFSLQYVHWQSINICHHSACSQHSQYEQSASIINWYARLSPGRVSSFPNHFQLVTVHSKIMHLFCKPWNLKPIRSLKILSIHFVCIKSNIYSSFTDVIAERKKADVYTGGFDWFRTTVIGGFYLYFFHKKVAEFC